MKRNASDPIYILGAGPAGLAAAYTLTQRGYPVVAIEREDRVGGLAKSFEYRDFILDCGPHRFYTKIDPVIQLWDDVLGDDQVAVDRLTRIYYQGKYFSYPLKTMDTLSTLGIWESLRIILSYSWAKLRPIRDPQNFADWVTSKFGRRLFEIFFQSYTEKLWGIPCTEISADWASQRIKSLSLFQAMRDAILGKNGKVHSLVDRFQYPRLGSGQLYDKIADNLRDRGQPILVNTEVVRLHRDRDRVTHLTLKDRHTGAESTVPCRSVISSIPITVLLQRVLHPSPPEPIVNFARSLKFRNTILVYLVVDRNPLFPDQWLYINDPRVKVGRVTNFANWSPHMLPNSHQTPLCCEYWCDFGDRLWNASDEQLRDRAERELRTIQLLADESVSSGFVLKLPRVYPVYSGNYKVALSKIQSYLQQFENLQLIGRYGSFKYNNQDHSLLMGILAAENVISPGSYDLWSVNSDSEYLEEIKRDRAPKYAPTTVQFSQSASR